MMGRYRIRLALLVLCAALLAQAMGATAEDGNVAALLEAVRGRTFAFLGDAEGGRYITFSGDNATVTITDFYYDGSGLEFVYQSAGTLSAAEAVHAHVLAIHVTGMALTLSKAMDEYGNDAQMPDWAEHAAPDPELTLLVAVPGADVSELDGRKYSMTAEQIEAVLNSDGDFSDDYPYVSSTYYLADLSEEAQGWEAAYGNARLAQEGWYTYLRIDDPATVGNAPAPEAPAVQAGPMLPVNLLTQAPADGPATEDPSIAPVGDLTALYGRGLSYHTSNYGDSLSFTLYADGTFEMNEFSPDGSVNMHHGHYDDVRQTGRSVYAFHIADMSNEIIWYRIAFRPGQTVYLALPETDPSELSGQFSPTADQQDQGLAPAWVPGRCYVAVPDDEGTYWLCPYELAG